MSRLAEIAALTGVATDLPVGAYKLKAHARDKLLIIARYYDDGLIYVAEEIVCRHAETAEAIARALNDAE